MSFYNVDEYTCISWDLIERTDLIFVNSNKLILSALNTPPHKEIILTKLMFESEEHAKEGLLNLYNATQERNKHKTLLKEIKELSIKVDEMYFMPDMPGYIKAKYSFEQK